MKQNIENLLIKSPQLLIIEDDRQQLSQMVAWLSTREGYLYQARSAEQAQLILNEQHVDAVISDWQLPGRSGLALIHELRQSGFKGPLLICTGMMLSPSDLRDAFDAGVDDYLRKPLNEIELNTRLDNALQLYAHRQALGLYSRSQAQFIQFLARHMGDGLDDLRALQTQIYREQTGIPRLQQACQLTTELAQHFHKLMQWARFRFALHTVQFHRFELKQLLKSICSDFQPQSDRLLIRGGKDHTIYSDPELLQRIVWQLLDNALKYSAGQVLIQIAPSDTGLRLSVIDGGENLSEGQAESLLTSRSLGLGLHICQDLLRLLGTELQLQKGRKGQTKFYFDLATA